MLVIVSIFLNWIESYMDYYIVQNRPKKLTPEYYENSNAWHSLSAFYYVVIVFVMCYLRYPTEPIEIAIKIVWMLLMRWVILDGSMGILLKRGFWYVGTTAAMDKATRKYAVKISSWFKWFSISSNRLSAALKIIVCMITMLCDILL